ncbi:MAG: 50S ribosomal protein L32 [Saprospiraceae bacterium]|nr:50S ribosomal protein L32 [Saprospiraceae bacterium]
MAHPKSRVSAQRRRKRRTHYKIGTPQIATCKTTGEAHL